MMCFVHGHSLSKQQSRDIVSTLEGAMHIDNLNKPYITLSGILLYAADGEIWEDAIPRLKSFFPHFWNETNQYFHLNGKNGTKADSGAQFCVHKELVLRIPKTNW